MDFFFDAFLSRVFFVLFTILFAIIIFIIADIFVLKKRVREYILPNGPVLLISYWTTYDRVERRISNEIKELLLKYHSDIGGNINDSWNSESRKKFKVWLSNSPKNQLKDDFIKINIELKKLDADIALLDDITSELHEKSKMIWPDFLVLIVPFIKQYPEIKVLSDNVKSFKSIVNRHTKMLIPHIDDYLSGNHHERVCQLISNYLPYFYGANVRLIETINNSSQFKKNHSSDIEIYFLKLNFHIGAIKTNLRSIKKELNKNTFILRPFSFIKNNNLELKWYDNKDIWSVGNESE